MLRQRLLVALIFLPLFVGLIFLPNPLYFFIFCLLGLAKAVNETGGLVRQRGLRFPGPAAFAGVLALAGWACVHGRLGVPLNFPACAGFWTLILAVLLALCLQEILGQNSEESFQGLCVTLFAILLLGGFGTSLIMLRRLDLGSWWVAMLFGFNWCYDAGAFFFGSWFGRTALAPRISPAKTWEGFAGGLAVNAAVAMAAYFLLLPRQLGFSWPGLLALGVGLGVLAQAGDLVESRLKRWSGIKDSDGFIPGHGGVLDKIDSGFFTAPLLLLIASLMSMP